MAEVYKLHYSADCITIHRPDGTPSTCKPDALLPSAVMAQLLSSAVDSGSDGITSHAPPGLLSPFLDLVCGQQDIGGMDTASLVITLKAADFFAHETAMQALCKALNCRLTTEMHRAHSVTTTPARAQGLSDDEEDSPSTSLILDGLPDHLAISVLQAYLNPHRFDTLLAALHEAYHPLLVQAKFPQIDSDKELHIRSGVTCDIDARLKAVDLNLLLRVLKTAPSFSCLTALTCAAHVFPTAVSEEQQLGHQFSSVLCQLSHLTRLDLGLQGLPDNDSFLTPHVVASVARALPAMITLRDLSLRGSSALRRTGCQELLEALQRCTGIESLSLTSVAIVAEAGYSESSAPKDGAALSMGSGRWAFGAALVHLTRLRALSLHVCHCDDQTLMPIQEVLESRPSGCSLRNLTSLSLRPAPVLSHLSRDRSRDHTKHLAAVLQHMTALQRISMKSSGGAVAALVSCLEDLQQLQYIDVCDSIGWDDVLCLSAALYRLPNLVHLDFGGLRRYEPAYRLSRYLCNESIQALADAVPGFGRLQYLSLSQCPLATCNREKGALTIAQALGCHSSLRTFAMDFSNCSYRVMGALGFSLRQHVGLQHLDLHGKYDERVAGSVVVDDDAVHETVKDKLTNAVEMFVQHLSGMSSLTGLRFSVRRAFLGASEAATVAIVSSLSALSKLESLDLSDLKVNDRPACEAMVLGVSAFTTLQTLRLVGNSILPPDVVTLMPTIKDLTLLSSLDLSQNRIRDAGALALAGEVAGLQCLRNLNLSDCGITQRGVAAVVAALEHHPYISEPLCPMGKY